MQHPKITVHMVVKNEDRFLWYALSSVLPFAEEVFITDTGSTDSTKNILKSFKNPKIYIEEKNISSPDEIAEIRSIQIEKTKTDWFWVVDGDEIYPESLSEEISALIERRGENLHGIVVARVDLLGDIYHYQDQSVGSYSFFGKSGHMVLRLLNKKNIPGISVKGIYPYEGYYDGNGLLVTNQESEKFAFTRGKLFHAMYLKRSSRGRNLSDTFHRSKFKIETGSKISPKVIPEVFDKYPKNIPDATKKRSLSYEIMAFLITPIKKIKRSLWKN